MQAFFYALLTKDHDNHERAVVAFKELEGQRLPERLLSTKLCSKRSRSPV